MIRGMIRFGVIAASAALVFAWPLAALIGAAATTVVTPVDEVFGDGLVAQNLLSFDPEFAVDPEAPPAVQARQLEREVASTYALNPREATTLVFADASRLKQVSYPDGDGRVTLYLWPGDHHPLQLQSVEWLSRMVMIGAGIALALLLALGRFIAREAPELRNGTRTLAGRAPS